VGTWKWIFEMNAGPLGVRAAKSKLALWWLCWKAQEDWSFSWRRM